MLLKFNSHVRSTIERANKVVGQFSFLFNNKYLPQKTKLLLYKAAIRPILLYGFPIWFSISPSVMKELEIFERKILRKCINKKYKNPTKMLSNTYIYSNSGIEPICLYALNIQKRFVEKLPNHDNVLMNEIYDRDKNISWSSSQYLSTIGILNENIEPVPGNTTPHFYIKATPGTHRG